MIEEVYQDNVIGYCLYCKEEILSGDTYIVRRDEKYHNYCHDLLFIEDGDTNNYAY